MEELDLLEALGSIFGPGNVIVLDEAESKDELSSNGPISSGFSSK